MIDSRVLGVSHRQIGRDEALVYSLQAPVGQPHPPHAFKQVWERPLRLHIEALRSKVKRLVTLAERGQPRGEEGVEPEAQLLAANVLPEGGFLGLLCDGHPHVSAYFDVAAEIPWEALEERYLRCSNGHRRTIPEHAEKGDTFRCQAECGVMERVSRKLVEDYHVTHCVYGNGSASLGGKKFLLVVDPSSDLFDSSFDPSGACERHCEELRVMLAHHGYEIILRRGASAKVEGILGLVADPSVAGLYYFGHGRFSTERGEGFLLLADGELSASEIEAAVPKPKFTFLNACSAGEEGSTFDFLDRRARSVAQAFARGPGKIVIAPVFPVFNVHAADTALQFFQKALDKPMGEALKAARMASLRAYCEDAPNVSWLAYRYFGDPNARLLVAAEPEVFLPASRVFDDQGQLRSEAFSFAVSAVLLAATARRNQQNRARLSVLDLLVGLIRKGDLTRFIFRQEGVDDPDALCVALEQRIETDNKPFHADHQEEQTGTRRRDFRDEVITLLERAAKVAGESAQISERNVLEVLVEGSKWAVDSELGLPPAPHVLKRLQERNRAAVDENGLVSLDGLDATARNIIESAHALAQQRGMQDIPNRLMLAALVADSKGFGARICRCAGVNSELLCFVMIALAEGEDFTSDPGAQGNPRTFGLSPEVCRKIVTPVMERAKKLAPADGVVGDNHLFRAFCEVANPAFKEWISEFPPELKYEEVELGRVNLDDLGQIEPSFWEALLEGLDEDSKRVIRSAHSLSQDCGVVPIPNRLVLAAFLSNPDGLVSNLLKRHQTSPETLRAQLIAASDSASQRKFPLNDAACSRAISPMLTRARALAAGAVVNESLLFRAFCDTAPQELKQPLRAPLWAVDLDVLAKEAAEGPKAQHDVGGALENSKSVDGPGGVGPNWDPHPFRAEQFESSAWRVVGESARLAAQQGWKEVRSPHLLAALFAEASGAVGKMLRDLPASGADLQKMALSMVPAQQPSPESGPIRMGAHVRRLISLALQMAGQQGHTQAALDDLLVAMCAEQDGPVANLLRALGAGLAFSGPRGIPEVHPTKQQAALATFGVDLTEKARLGQLPEIVGRDDEINTALQTLLLLENANPLLVGEAGVGKTAIVEGIARRIVHGPCPKKLQSMRVVELSAGRLLANTRLRGEFEQRIQEVLAEAREGVILFIDEIHSIVGAGTAEGTGPDAGNMLKTALARGDVHLIGATTHTEFKRSLERDKALSRRFQVQIIRPPSRETTILVLSARQPALEKHHEVKISEEAKLAAVDLSGRYIVDKQWPAKARDVLERACVLAVTEEMTSQAGNEVLITAGHVATVVSRWTGVPLERLSASDWQSLASLEERLGSRIIGQQEAIRIVADAIRRGRQGIANDNRPWGVFLFVGPPGVGKTELAKVIGEEVFGGVEGLVRFDMGDFTEPHSTAKLIGAPPGYVGYEQGAPLVEGLRTHPHSLLLFDEVEHAHENVLAVLLRLLSEGMLADHDGNVADGRNCIVVLTSNLLGPGEQHRRMGFSDGTTGADQADLRTLLERSLPRKLIDRLDAIVRFNALTPDALEQLVAREVTDRKTQVELAHGITVNVTKEVTPWLTARVSEAGQGARAVRRTVNDHFDAAITTRFSEVAPYRGCHLVVSVRGDGGAIEALWAAGNSPTLSGPR